MAAAFAIETAHSTSGPAPHMDAPGFTPHIAIQAKTVWSPAAQATLRLLERQQLRTQLRC